MAHLINEYPKVSHTFIRREIMALERLGHVVHRYALRGWKELPSDLADRHEQSRTRYLLRNGAIALLAPLMRSLRADPLRCLRAFGLALTMSLRSNRPLPFHLVYLAEAAQLVEWLREAGATHLHAHFGTNSAEVAMLARALGGPLFSMTVHGPEEFDRPEAIGLSRKIVEASFVVAVSSFGRSQLLRWVPHGHWHKVHVVRCGFEPALLEPAQRCGGGPRLVCVGRICEQKGQLLLVEAASRLVRAGVPIELVLVGDGEMRSAVEELAAELGVSPHLRITGWATGDTVRDEILAARALVLPSFAEGLPVVIMESFALGRPAISTYVAGIPELLVSGENGWLVPAGDVGAIERAMRAALEAPTELLDAMGAAGRTRVSDLHDVDREAARLVDCIRQVCHERAGQMTPAAERIREP